MTYIDYKKKMEFSKKEYVELIKYCKKIEIKWFASCWDEDSVDFMENLNVPIYKVASASLTDINLLKRIKEINEKIKEKINAQIELTRKVETSPKNTSLYFNILLKTKDIFKMKVNLIEEYYNSYKQINNL